MFLFFKNVGKNTFSTFFNQKKKKKKKIQKFKKGFYYDLLVVLKYQLVKT